MSYKYVRIPRTHWEMKLQGIECDSCESGQENKEIVNQEWLTVKDLHYLGDTNFHFCCLDCFQKALNENKIKQNSVEIFTNNNLLQPIINIVKEKFKDEVQCARSPYFPTEAMYYIRK